MKLEDEDFCGDTTGDKWVRGGNIWRRVQEQSKAMSPEARSAQFRAFRAMVRDPMHSYRVEEEMRRIAVEGRAYNDAARASGRPKWRAAEIAGSHILDGSPTRRESKPKKERPHTHWTAENIFDLERAYAGEITLKVVADRVGCVLETCRRKAVQLGLARTARASSQVAWDKASLAALAECWENDGSVKMLAEALGRSVFACRGKAGALGLSRQNTGNATATGRQPSIIWSPESVAAIRACWDTCGNIRQLAASLGTSVERCRRKAEQLGLVRRVRWTAEQDAKLCEMRDAGLGAKVISETLGHKTHAVYARAKVLGLARHAAGRAPRHLWTEGDITILEDMRVAGSTAKAIADTLGRTERSVARKVEELGLPKKPKTRRR